MTSLHSSIATLRGIGSRRRDPVPGEASGRIGLALLAAVLFAFFSFRYANFTSSANLLSIAVSNSAVLMAAVGSMALLIAGKVDVSIGSMYGLVGMLVAWVVVHTGSPVLAVATGLGAGIVFGGVNGLLVRKLTISPIIVTLATFGLYRGLASLVSDSASISGFPDSFLELGRGGIGRISWPIIVAVVSFVLVSLWLTRTRTGLRVYAMGGDARAAALNGVAVGRTTVMLFTLNGALIGLLAVLTTARLNLGNPTTGTGFEFDVLTAAILGGIAFAGGGGRPAGVFAGVLVLAVINAGLIFENLQDYWQQIVRGGLLLIALAADQYAQHRREHRVSEPSRAASAVPAAMAEAVAAADPPPRDVASEPRVVLEGRGMTKRYGALLAVDHVDVSISAGEIVCLIGDNGAGKSTLIKMLSGAVQPDEGEIRVDGRAVRFGGPRAAQEAGIKTVYQDLALCPNLSVAHNFVLGHEPVRRLFGLVPLRDDAEAERRAERYLANLGIRLASYRTVVRMLSGGQRQSLAIARAVESTPLVAILDEPTAALGVKQTKNVLDLVRVVAARGTAVILISHDVQTIMELADRIVVLRLGEVLHDGPVSALSKLELLELMAGITEPKPLEALPAADHAQRAHRVG